MSYKMHSSLAENSLRLCAFAWFILLCASHVNAYSRVTISLLNSSEVEVQADLYSPSRSWSFRNAYAGVLGIAERVYDFKAITRSGEDAGGRKIATGEYRADLDAIRIRYKLKLSQPTPADVSHVSWVYGDNGLFMLADLLPQDFTSLSLEFKLPSGWTIGTSNTSKGEAEYEVVAPDRAVFIAGRFLRKTSNTVDGMPLDLVVSGAWPFKDKDASRIAAKVLKKYLELTGFSLPGRSTIMIAPLPVAVGSVKWRAETRGSTVVLLMDPAAAFAHWIGQLGVIFTHETLHLWVPNSLRLEGDYDWFFEGFTLYTALRTAMDLKLINFKEFLDTLARVYDSYLSYAGDLSLIDASERRWTTPGSLVYDKGMLVAFLYDLMIRKESGGRTTLADRYRQLFSGRAADHGNGNDVIIAALGSSPAAEDFTKSYIKNSTKLELERLLPAYGFTLDSSGRSTQLRVNRESNSDQKRLLRSLGYRD
jgi:predicted metalloprotease with PDZ domain